MYEVASSFDYLSKERMRDMPKLFGMNIDGIMFYLLYFILGFYALFERNIFDIIYFIALTICLIRLWLFRIKNKKIRTS